MSIFLVILLGLAIRLISINQSLWLDEGTTALISQMSIKTIFMSFLPGDFHPPLYYILIKAWSGVFGFSEIALRLPSLLFGVSSIYTTYLIAKHFYNAKAGIYAALLLSTSGLAVYYSQEARMYSMTAFLVSLTVYLFLKKKWLPFSIALALTGLTDYVALFILPVLVFYGYKQKKFFYSLIPLLIVFLAWQPIFLKQISVGLFIKSELPGWWNILGSLSAKNLALFPVKFILGRIGFDNNIIYGAVVFITFLIFAYPLKKGVKSGKFLVFWLITPILIASLLAFKIPTLNYFRFLFCLPPLYILTAGGLSMLNGRIERVLMAMLLLLNISATGYYLSNPRFHREDWRGLTRFVESNKSAESITVFVAKSNMEAYKYYAPSAKIAGPEALNDSYDRLWLMTYLTDIFDPGKSVKARVEDLGYEYLREYNFNGVGVIEYRNTK